MMRRQIPQNPARAQRGIGAVVVVMVLFFVVSLMAAYTSRNLIFEQKTSANQARNTLAFEAADAGIEWTLYQLNGGLIDDDCGTATPALSFQQRYVNVVNTNGSLGAVARTTSTSGAFWPTCVFDGSTGWTCKCPNASSASPTPATGVAPPQPAFRVWIATPEGGVGGVTSPWSAYTPALPGFLDITVASCTSMPDNTQQCLDFVPRGDLGEGMASIRATLALRSGLSVPPSAAITARGSLTPHTGSVLHVINSDRLSQGFTVNLGAGGTPASELQLETLPGTPTQFSYASGDSRLASFATTAPATSPPAPPALTAGERMFASVFGMKRPTYRDQPGLRFCASPCSTTQINTLLQNNPNRVIWVDGNLTVDANIGDSTTSPVTPVLLIVDGGTLTINSGRTIYGFVYMTGGGTATSTIELPTGGATTIRGALVAEGNLVTHYASTPSASDALTVQYDRTALDRLRTSYGSWVRLPAAWRDFKAQP